MAARNNPILSCFFVIIFVVLLVSSYGIRLTEEARVLKIDHDSGNRVTNTSSHYGGKHLHDDAPTVDVSGNFVAEEYDSTEDLHPTSPGHSPSIGHSTGPATHDHN
ncbi:hypothetical protein COLO4_26459 [Corchorus olitorius]|uniref:Uncharacterized protein n=1 Tax=Corchorus olitorius TaxID=93759 RepID=A0A1R3HX05_9ROSI|nr:hypothetical protein COLO4_26459 [Corchorus olitorius]